jgi:hypothetical protein
VVEGDEAREQCGGDHWSPRFLFTGSIHTRRPVIAASVPGMGMDLSYEKK